MEFLLRWYSRRIVNVNVNIIIAGAVALFATGGIMHALVELGLPSHRKFLVGAITFFVDLVVDVGVYYALHWIANHMPRMTAYIINPAYANQSFIRGATLVQFERALLSPLLYVFALSLQHWALHSGHSVFFATTVGFAIGITITRVLHTIWMLYSERRAAQRHAERSGAESKLPS